ncbi:MAG: hypothetical protein ACOYL6_18280 [Bacteriovoracaceae bacterium]
MKKIIIGLVVLSSVSAFSSDEMICGKIKSLSVASPDQRMYIILHDDPTQYVLEGTTGSNVALAAKIHNLEICLSYFVNRGTATSRFPLHILLKD